MSLLADARGHRVIPSVRSINNLSRRSSCMAWMSKTSRSGWPKALPADRDEFSLLVALPGATTRHWRNLGGQLFETFLPHPSR